MKGQKSRRFALSIYWLLWRFFQDEERRLKEALLSSNNEEDVGEEANDAEDEEDNVEVEYVQENISIPKWDPNYAAFNKIFEAFKVNKEMRLFFELSESRKDSGLGGSSYFDIVLETKYNICFLSSS